MADHREWGHSQGKTSWETSVGQTDLVWSSGFLTWWWGLWKGEAGKGQEASTQG